MNKDLLSGFDLSIEDIQKIFALTKTLKHKPYASLLRNKMIALIFQKPSMRTRVSFEVGAQQLGAQCIYLSPQDVQLGRREPIKDIARVLSRYVDAIIARTFAHEHIEELASHASASVINGLSDAYHPCQALADVFTMLEKKSKAKKTKVAFVGDGNNVVHSLLAVTGRLGMSFSIATPRGYEPRHDIWQRAEKVFQANKETLMHTHDPREAVKDADIIYTDVWTSMGQENEQEKRRKDFQQFQVNKQLVEAAGKQCLVMHCMPVHRGEEITDEIMESPQSIIIDQAENRLHVQKAIMALLLKKNVRMSRMKQLS